MISIKSSSCLKSIRGMHQKWLDVLFVCAFNVRQIPFFFHWISIEENSTKCRNEYFDSWNHTRRHNYILVVHSMRFDYRYFSMPRTHDFNSLTTRSNSRILFAFSLVNRIWFTFIQFLSFSLFFLSLWNSLSCFRSLSFSQIFFFISRNNEISFVGKRTQ